MEEMSNLLDFYDLVTVPFKNADKIWIFMFIIDLYWMYVNNLFIK